MGTSSDAVNKIYVNDIVVSGDLTFMIQDIGTTAIAITNAHFENLFANTFVLGNQTFPTSAGNNGDLAIYIDGTGQMFWRKPVSNIANIFARGGTSSSNTSVTLDGISETTFIIDIGAGDGITVLDDQIEVNMGAFDTDDLIMKVLINLYFTDARARSATATDAGGLGSLLYTPVGTITYNGPSDAEVIGVFLAVRVRKLAPIGVVNSVDSETSIHDALQNFDGDEHVHADVITAGDGLTGGGDITGVSTLNVGEGYAERVADDVVAVSNTEAEHCSQGDGTY